MSDEGEEMSSDSNEPEEEENIPDKKVNSQMVGRGRPRGRTSKAKTVDEEENDEEEVNIFKATLLDGKRKRFVPIAEQTLQDWLSKHFVEKQSARLQSSEMYSTYLDACSSISAGGVDEFQFRRAVDKKFPKGVALAEDSPYVDIIHVAKKKLPKTSSPLEKGIVKPKMIDLIKEAIIDLGNPRNGIRFHAIKNNMSGKYPELHVEAHENRLKQSIDGATYRGDIECVRGAGRCGYYRLPRTKEEEEAELEEEKRVKEEMKKEKDAKKAAGDNEENEKVEEAEEEATATKEGAGDGDATKKKKKKKSRGSHHKKTHSPGRIIHSDPQRIEDAFPLAMTYQCEPKEASFGRIRNYITNHYKDIHPEKLRSCLESGTERGYWSLVSGSAASGTYRLTIQEFDPTADDDLIGMVMNAIVACTEPKTCSAMMLKEYVKDYHPNFNLEARPKKFLHSIERATANGQIIRLSGIGGSGSFQLAKPFSPSPRILQGKDTTRDYESSDADDDNDEVGDYYKPRPSKRHARPKATHRDFFDPSLPNPRSVSKAADQKRKSSQSSASKYEKIRDRSSSKGAKTAKMDEDSYSEEDKDSDDEPVTAKKTKKSHKTAAVSNGRANDNVSPSKKRGRTQGKRAQSDSEEEDVVEYTPRKSKSRGGGGVERPAAFAPKSHKKGAGKSRKTGAGKSHKKGAGQSHKKGAGKKQEATSDDEEERSADEVEYTPQKSSRESERPAAAERKSHKKGAGIKSGKASSEDEEDMHSEVEYTPRKSTSRGGSASIVNKSVEKNKKSTVTKGKPTIKHAAAQQEKAAAVSNRNDNGGKPSKKPLEKKSHKKKPVSEDDGDADDDDDVGETSDKEEGYEPKGRSSIHLSELTNGKAAPVMTKAAMKVVKTSSGNRRGRK